ncbi:hypothetical protein HBR94_16145 [Pseudomonas sp. WS 5412]|uniref:hypothetical protein n=1 Tax=Pseudomonas sp. WS 5412 TaxID=2717487 RepID=UPI0014752AF8|nr:hypothetical protein [Pseudomonas sp. WS 5412]NMY33030.1 hypothetical protein [Pseudomonas sp. WS 5412]
MKNFYIVGFYEDFKLNVFPTHASPIIAEQQNGQFRRWAYRIEKPYKIIPTHSVGQFYDSPNLMFAYITYTLSTPTPLQQHSQIVAISRDKILVEHRKFHLCCKIVTEALKNFHNFGFVYRAYLSIKNAIS